MAALTGRVAEVAAQAGEASLEGEEVAGTADGVEDGVMPEGLPAPATEGMDAIVEPGVKGHRGRQTDVPSQECRQDHARMKA